MRNIKITPAILGGQIDAPPSKSVAHRAVIAAALASGTSTIHNIAFSEDISATLNAIGQFGAKVKTTENAIKITGGLFTDHFDSSSAYRIDCAESGSTLRFLIPVALLSSSSFTFSGRGKLGSRPLTPYIDIFKEQQLFYSSETLPMTIKGQLKPGRFHIDGSISSQFITGLLYALPLLDGDSMLYITSPLESSGYVDLTIDLLQHFGIHIQQHNYKEFFIKGKQHYASSDISIEGDYSQAAFWLAAGLLGDTLTCRQLNKASRQGDKAFIQIAAAMNGRLEPSENAVTAYPSCLKGSDIDVSQIPDLAPILAVLGALSAGTTRILNARRLRLKESDRLTAIVTELKKLGADIEETGDGIIIRGKYFLKGGEVCSWNDHRIAMALAIASVRCLEPVFIEGAAAINKSYPNFFEHFNKLGGKAYEQ